MSAGKSALKYAIVMLSITIGTITKWEGKSNKAYLDLVQVPTVCYGSTQSVKLGDIKTDSECIQLLLEEIYRLDTILTDSINIDLEPHQRAAFVSWMYNVGETAFRSSTLLKMLLNGNVQAACNELPRWVYAKGNKIQGLVNRRKDEQELCLGYHNDKI